jgi:hypothetical protein
MERRPFQVPSDTLKDEIETLFNHGGIFLPRLPSRRGSRSATSNKHCGKPSNDVFDRAFARGSL